MNKPSGKMTMGVLGCLGCFGCGGFFFVAVFGVGLIGAFLPSGGAPMLGPVPSVAPSVVPAGTEPVEEVHPSSLSYTFEGPCPGDGNLNLERFQVAYESTYTILHCRDQQPSPWSYVTFHREEEGVMQRQVTLATAFGDVQQSTLAAAADAVAVQLGSATVVHNEAPYIARGEALLRRDAVFEVSESQGRFTPGSYLIRQVWVTDPRNRDSLIVQMLSRIDPALGVDSFLATQAELRNVVESIGFE